MLSARSLMSFAKRMTQSHPAEQANNQNGNVPIHLAINGIERWHDMRWR